MHCLENDRPQIFFLKKKEEKEEGGGEGGEKEERAKDEPRSVALVPLLSEGLELKINQDLFSTVSSGPKDPGSERR